MDYPAIKIQHLNFSYPNGKQALSNINLEIAKGEKVALLGLNGAGKSTLLLHLNGILQSGFVQIEGLPLVKANLAKIRAKVGLVFQNPDDQLFCLTVYEDVAFGPRHMGLGDSEVQQRVKDALAWVGMSGYEKQTSYHLSLGEKKRIALATVLSMNAEILVLDEPNAGLDTEGLQDLLELLQGLNKTLILSTHDIQLATTLCNRVITLERGQIVSDDAPNSRGGFLHDGG